MQKIISSNTPKPIKDYNQAIELNPQNEKAYNNRGIAKVSLKEYEEAEKDYNQAIELNPQDAEAYNNRGLQKLISTNTPKP